MFAVVAGSAGEPGDAQRPLVMAKMASGGVGNYYGYYGHG